MSSSDGSDQGDDFADENEQVGYGRPPKARRFVKGRSGNPRGRPKGSGLRSSAEKVLDRKVTVTEDGVQRTATIIEALLLQMSQRALAGDAVARRELLKIAGQVAQAAADADTKGGGTTVVIKRFGQPKGCTGALEVLGVIIEVGDGSGALKVQPWVLEAALARGARLSDADRDLVEQFTVTSLEVPTPKLNG
jgi:hypothetical protein